MVTAFNKHLQEANEFTKYLALQLEEPENTDLAVRVLRAVFKALRKRIAVEESMHLISQLPLLLKGMYVDGWNIHQPFSDAKTIEDFLFEIRNEPDPSVKRDFQDDDEAIKRIVAVINALKKYVSEGELHHIKAELPKGIAEVIL